MLFPSTCCRVNLGKAGSSPAKASSTADRPAIPARKALRPPARRLHHPRHLPGRSENAHLAKPLHLRPQQPRALCRPQRPPPGCGRPTRPRHHQPPQPFHDRYRGGSFNKPAWACCLVAHLGWNHRCGERMKALPLQL